MSIRAKARHGIVFAADEPPANYFGWPSAARLEDGSIVVGCSGFRHAHVCPYGKSVLFFSADGARSFGPPQIVHDDLIDDRDLGVIALGGQSLGITWFSQDTRQWNVLGRFSKEEADRAKAYMDSWKDEEVSRLLGSFTALSRDGGKSWQAPIRVPVSAPHGYVRLQNGDLGYVGKAFPEEAGGPVGALQYAVSRDGGKSFEVTGELLDEASAKDYHEPHLIELKDGRLMAAIRQHINHERGYSLDTCLSFSEDGGKSWSAPEPLHVSGAPPQLLRHSSGAIVLSYGYREKGFGQRARLSRDEGETWSDEIIIRDDGESEDLGYPCSIELDDGSIFTVYYQALPGRKNTAVQYSVWHLPNDLA